VAITVAIAVVVAAMIPLEAALLGLWPLLRTVPALAPVLLRTSRTIMTHPVPRWAFLRMARPRLMIALALVASLTSAPTSPLASHADAPE
jgi:hypothetical protein